MLTVTSNPTRTSPGEARQVDPGEHPRHAAAAAAAGRAASCRRPAQADGHAAPADGAAPGQPEAAPSATPSWTRSASASRTSTPSAPGGRRTTSCRSTPRACCPAARRSRARLSCERSCSGRPDMFRRCLAEKLLTYALGRGLEYYDQCAVDEIVARREERRRHASRPWCSRS